MLSQRLVPLPARYNARMNDVLKRDAIGAFCRHTHAEVAAIGGGPLAGLSCGIKDLYDIAGHKTGFGSPAWLETHAAATATAPVVQRLIDAGAQIVGKTHTDEMAYSLNGENPHYGTPVNVNAPGRIPGGSSSGSAAAVAAGLVDFALGSDTGGSVRAPASFCGIYGLRPTHGRLPMEGACALAASFDVAGWFARDARLLERVSRVLLEDDKPAPTPGALLYADDAFALVDGQVQTQFEPALASLTALLGAPRKVIVSSEGLPQWFQVFRKLQAAEAWTQHAEWIQRAKPQFGPGVRERFEWAATVSPADVAPLKVQREVIASRMDELLRDNALLVLPTVHTIASMRNTPAADLDDFRGRAMSLLCIAGLARLPQISLPLARFDGCPLGISLVAARGNDMLLLDIASRLAA
ncbi:MAG: putative amidase [Betaproteobacteria bacterium]|nr:putative amidase [Betaproteobacteria bacterium]